MAVLLAAVRCGGGDSLTLPSEKLPAKLTIDGGDAQQGTVGIRLTDTLVVRVTNSKNEGVATAKVVFQRLAGGTGGAVIPDTAVTDVDGRARSVWVLGRLAGAQSVVVRVVPPVAGPPLSVTFHATGIAAAPDTIFAALGDQQTGAVGTTLTDSLAVLVTDQFGNPVSGQNVSWSVPAGQGSVSAASVTTGGDGRAAVQRRLGPTTGSQTATATLVGVKGSPVSFSSTATAGGAVRAVKLWGDLQTAPAGFQLTDSVVVQVQDANGNGVPNRNVNWVVTDGGSVTPLTSTTDAQGKAFAYWTLKPTAGANQLTAAASGLAQLQFAATGTSATPSQIVAQSSTSIAGTAGLGVAQKPSVKVTDANSNPVQGVTVTFLVTAGGGSVSDGTGNGPSASVATNASGVATLTSWTLGTVAGVPNTVTATATGTGISGNPVTFNATAAAGAAARVQLTTQPSAGAQSGVVLAQQPVLQLRDAFGNAVSQANVQVTAAIIGAGAALHGTATVSTSASGVAAFSGLNLFGTVGAYSLGFSAGGIAGDTSSVIALTAGAASQLAITTQPAASAQSGVPFATQPVVQVQDAAGNPVTGGVVQVAAAIATGGGTLGGTTPIATVNGSASFTDLSITGAAGPRTLSFSATGLTTAVSGTVTLGAGVPTQLGISTQPSSSAQSGSVFAQQPVIVVKDATGNTVGQAGVSVTVAITGAPAGVTLGGNPTVLTTAAGTASFTGLSLSGPAGNYTLSFSATSLTGVTSSVIALAAGSGTTLTITTQPPASGQSGVPLAPATVIQLRDGVGNAVNQAGVAVVASIASGASGVLTGSDTALTNASGVATFSNLVISGAVGSYTLAFNGTGLTGVTATPTLLSAGPAAKLALTTQPSATAQSGVLFTTQPVLQLQDGAGNAVSQAGVAVTAAIASGGGTLGGTLTATTGGNGQAVFTDLMITGTVGPRTLGFSATGLAGVSSGSIALSAGAAASIAKVAGDGQSATAGSPLPIDPQVKVTDASGNPVSGVVVGFAVTGGGGSVGPAQPTDVNGLASATWTLGPSSGANTLDATATLTGGPTTVTFSATGTAGTAGKLGITTQPSATAASGSVFAQQPVIQLQDQNGNPVTTSGVAITAQSSGNLGGNVTVATVNGVAAFTNLSLSGLVGNYTLTFTGTNLTGVTSNAIALTPGQAVGLVVLTQPGATEQSGIAFAQQPVLQVVDAAGNAVPTSGRQVTAAINTGPGGTINPAGRTVTTNASGTASFTALTLTGPVGSYTLLFSSTGLAAVQSGSFTLAAGPATQISANSVTSQSATVGTAVAAPPSVKVVDAVGNPVSGVAVTFAVTAGGGSLNGASQTTDTAGVATVTSWTLGGSAGANTVTATATGLAGSPVNFSATGVAGTATTIAVNAGNNQSATVNTGVATAPSVRVTDANNNPVANVSVTFAVGSGGGSITGASATTNAQGIAAVGSWTLGTIAGPNTLTATSGSLSGSPVTFTATGTAGAATSMVISAGDGQTATIGTAVGIPPQVLISDGFGNPKSGVGVTFAVATGGGSVVPTSPVLTNASGLATVTSWTLGSLAGANTLTANATGLTGVTFTATGTAGGATKIALSAGNNQSATVGTAVAIAPAVLVTDAGNNPVANVSVTFAVATGGGSVIGGSATTNSSGIASVGSWTLGTTAGPNTLTATSTGLSGSPVTFTATGTAGAPASMVINGGNGQTATVNTAVATAPSVKILDANSNPVPNVGVTFAVATGGGSVSLATPVTNGAGIATVGSWTLGTTAGSNSLTANSTGLTGVTFTATGTAGAAAAIAISAGDGQSAQVGTAVAIPPQVLVTDGFGNPRSGVNVTFAVASGGGTVVPTSAVATNASGLAAVTSWTLGATAGANSLTATATGSGITGNPVTFGATATSGVPTSVIANSVTTQSATVGTAVAAPPSVLVRDAVNNPVPGVTVTFAITAGAGGILVGASQTTNSSGIATLTSWTLDTTARTNTVTATVSGSGIAGNPVSFNATGTAGAATKIIMNRQPSTTVQSGVIFPITPRVQVADQYNNAVATPAPGIVITASVLTSPGGTPVLTPLTATTSTAGLATFTNFTLTGLVGSYSFQFDATASGFGTVASSAVTLTAGPATTLSFTTPPPSNASSGVAFSSPPVLQLRDGAGNAVVTAGSAITASIASGPTGGSLTNAVATTAAGGAATFTGLTLTGTAGSYTLSFVGTGLTPVTSSAIALTAGGGSQLGVTTQPSSSVPNGQAFPQQPVIQLQDGSGNPVSLAGVSVLASINSGSGATLGGTLTQLTNSNGQAVFTNLALTGTAGNFSLLFAASGYVSVGSSTIALTAGAPSTIAITTQPSASAQNTIAFGQQPVAVVRDQSNNLVPGTGVTASIATGAGTLGGVLTVFTDGAGVATFGNLEITGVTGSRTLKLTAGSATTTTTAVTITPGPVSGPQSTATVPNGTIGLSTSISVVARDVSGNPVGVGGATVVISVSGNNSAVPTVTDNGNGTYSASYTPTAAGSDNVAISLNASPVSGSPFASTVSATSSTTTITSVSAPSSVVGQAYTVDFGVSGAGVTPTGSVTVSDGSQSCIGSLSGGAGSCQITSTTAGAKTLVATYGGDANYTGSSSAGVGHTVSAASTTTAITSDTPDPSSVGSAYTVSFTVAASAPGSGTPTGNVTVSDGTDSCTGTVAAGSCSLTSTTAGSKTLVATYAGDGNFLGSTSAGVGHNVNSAATTTTIVGHTPDPSVVGQGILVSYTVTSTGGTPNGSVTVSDGTGATCTSSVASGSCTLTTATAGAKTLTATYAGNGNFGGSISAGVSQTVNQASTTTAITSDLPDPSVIGQQITVDVTVSSAFATPGGAVTVSDGTDGCTIAALSGGAGSCSFTPTTAGTKTITATYGGDANHTGSSGTASHQVDPFGAAVALHFSVQPSNVVQNATMTPAVEVQLLDAFGNLVSNATDAVTIAIANDPVGGSVLSGTLTVNALNGVASFGDLSINQVGTGFTLSVTSGILSTATSTSFDVQ